MATLTESTQVEETAREVRAAETARLFAERAGEDDAERRGAIEQQLAVVNLPIAHAVARRFFNRGLPSEDLESVASLGLVKAVRGFDPDRGYDFLAFAVPTIRGEVRRYFRDHGWTIRPPRPIQETQAKIAGCQGDLYQLLGRAPRPSEIAEHLGVEVADVVEALGVHGCFDPVSLDAPLSGADGGGPTLGAALASDLDPGFDGAELRALLAPVLAGLSPRDRLIVELRFTRNLTQAEIGERIGVTQMQVSRLLKQILDQLRAALSQDLGADAAVAQLIA